MKIKNADYEQDMHCCGSINSVATLSIKTHDGGGGEYIVITADEWAIADKTDLDEFVAAITGALERCK